MQRKYNMALQHFYQAATQSTTDDDDIKAKLQDLSGSEEDLFENEKLNEEYYEMKEINSDANENNYFMYKKRMTVKRIKPVSICSWRGCALLCVWFVLFFVGVVSISFCLQTAITRIPTKNTIKPRPIPIYNNTTNAVLETHNYTQPCSNFTFKKIWVNSFDKFWTKSSFRLADINQDGVDDILFGFETSIDSYKTLEEARDICKRYYKNVFPCFGGVVAANGKTGEDIWIHYAMHGVRNINCNADLDNDGVADCLCTGYRNVFEAISGKTGKLLWKYDGSQFGDNEVDFFTPQFINDMDNDGVLDILEIQSSHQLWNSSAVTPLSGKILFISGRGGKLLESYNITNDVGGRSSPVIYRAKNGSDIVVYGTGDETHRGDMFVITLADLYEGKLNKSIKILSNRKKGFTNPPVLVDINKDGVSDIINAGFGHKIQAVDGDSLKTLWTYQSSNTETYSIPSVGYYNDDDTVDFFVRVNIGSGYPVYYDSKVLVLDGLTGLPLTKDYKTSVPAHSSPLSVSMEGIGNDLFLYWSVDCFDHEHEGGWYDFVPQTNLEESSQIDSCFERFRERSFTKFFVTNAKTGLPGMPIYYSEDHLTSEIKNQSAKMTVPSVPHIFQTGTVAPSITNQLGNELDSKFDVVFATSYITPPNVRVMIPSDMKCIKEFREKASRGEVTNDVNVTSNNERGIYDAGDTAINHCLSKRINDTKLDDVHSARGKNFDNGKLTLYRYQVTCECGLDNDCVRVLPKSEQGWSAYMGSLTNALFNARPDGRLHNG